MANFKTVKKALECRKNAHKRCGNPCEDFGQCAYSHRIKGNDGAVYLPYVCNTEKLCDDTLNLLEELHGMSIEGFREFMYRQLHEQKITCSCMEQANIMLDKWKKEQPKAEVKLDLKDVPSITEEIRQMIRNLPSYDHFGEPISEPKPKGQIKIQKTLSITFPAGECSDEIVNQEIVRWLISNRIISTEIKQTAEGVELVYSIADGGGQE